MADLINPSGRRVEVSDDRVPALLAEGFQLAPPLRLKGFDATPGRAGALVAVYSVYNEREYIEANLAHVYPFVDRILCLVNTHPWAGTTEDYPPDGTADLIQHFPDPEEKIDLYAADWHDGTHGGQLAQRSFGLSKLRAGDWYWLIDGDEFTPPEAMGKLRGFTMAAQADCLQVYFRTLWQTFRHVGWCEWVPRLFRVKPGARFVGPCTVADPSGVYSQGRIPYDQVYTFHCGYVRSDRRMAEKMGIYGRRSKRGDFYGGFDPQTWWNETWLHWRSAPESVQTSVHPTGQYGGALNAQNGPQPLEVPLPEVLRSHPYHIPEAGDGTGDASILTVTHRSSRPLKRMLETLVATADPGQVRELVWVDNGSPDADLCAGLFSEAAALLKAPLYEVRNPDNRMFTKAVNQGLARTTGRLILLLNPDCEFHRPGWLVRMIADLDATPGGGIAGCKMITRDGRIHHAGGRALSRTSFVHIGRDATDLGQYDTRKVVDWVTGACFLVRREVYIALGPLDERHVHYDSDNRYCLAAQQAGFQVVYSPAEIIHEAGKSVQAPLKAEELEAPV